MSKMKVRRVLIPGSYDPVTEGHLEIVRHALLHFDEVHAVVFVNPAKRTMFTMQERLALLREACAFSPRIVTGADTGTVEEYAKKNDISLLVKGVRSEHDLAYELPMADHHRERGIDTLFLSADPLYTDVSSSAVREALTTHAPIAPRFLHEPLLSRVTSLYEAKYGKNGEKSTADT